MLLYIIALKFKFIQTQSDRLQLTGTDYWMKRARDFGIMLVLKRLSLYNFTNSFAISKQPNKTATFKRNLIKQKHQTAEQNVHFSVLASIQKKWQKCEKVTIFGFGWLGAIERSRA